jgi:hypothetical protein
MRIGAYQSFYLQVCASVSPDAASTTELEQWNEQYGEGGSRQKTQLTYFM